MRQIQARNRALTVKLMSILHFHSHSMHELTWRASRQPVCGKRIAAKMPKPRAYSGRGSQACAGCISRAMLRSMACIYAIFCRAKPYLGCTSSAILRRSRPCSHAQSYAAQIHIQNALHPRYYGAQDYAHIRNRTPRKVIFRMHMMRDIRALQPSPTAAARYVSHFAQDAVTRRRL